MPFYVRAIVLVFTLLSSGGDRFADHGEDQPLAGQGLEFAIVHSEFVQAPTLPPSPATPLVLNLCDSEIDEEEDPDLDGRFFSIVSVDLSWHRPLGYEIGGDVTSTRNTGVAATIAFAIRC
jgi:hypothetical protein